MKKLVIPVIVLLLVSLLVACGGNGDGNEYTGDFNEYSNNSSSSDNLSVSSDNSGSDIVTVPLTTQPGATVPEVTTTQPTTAPPTVDYTPIIPPDTTKPIPNTTYYADPNTTTTSNISSLLTTNDSTSNTDEDETTSSELKYVKISSSGDDYTDVAPDGEKGNELLILTVESPKLKGKPTSTSGKNAIVTVNGKSYSNRKYKVLSKLDGDGRITVEVDASGIEIITEDKITITLQEGSIKTDENYSNKKFTSQIGYAI